MARIHPTALIEHGVKLGAGTSVWDNVHIRKGAVIGHECNIGEKSYITHGVQIGDRVTIDAMVYIGSSVTIENGVTISASVTFTDERCRRATFPDLRTLKPAEPTDNTLPTIVRAGATIGAGCVIGNDLEIGRWAMVGMGSVITESVPDFHFVVGSPTRSIGAVCKCGLLFHRFGDGVNGTVECSCGLAYDIIAGMVSESKPLPVKRPRTEKELAVAYA